MYRLRFAALAILVAAMCTVPGASQSPAAKKKEPPRLVPVAETKLLMEGLAHPNFLGIERILKSDEADAESWAFARGQAILIAESANLLMMRPPKNAGQDAWMQHATRLRDQSTDLARSIAKKDLNASRAGLITLGNQCNSCHQTFRVPMKVSAFAPMDVSPMPRNP